MTRTVDTDDGIAIEYEVYGTGQLTLLFLHGWGNAASAWDDFLTAHLNLTGLRCVAASYRGHGGSGTARSGYTHERFARDMFAVADAVEARRFVMVGFSMAGKFGRYIRTCIPRVFWGKSSSPRLVRRNCVCRAKPLFRGSKLRHIRNAFGRSCYPSPDKKSARTCLTFTVAMCPSPRAPGSREPSTCFTNRSRTKCGISALRP
jgi:hypothetical protein